MTNKINIESTVNPFIENADPSPVSSRATGVFGRSWRTYLTSPKIDQLFQKFCAILPLPPMEFTIQEHPDYDRVNAVFQRLAACSDRPNLPYVLKVYTEENYPDELGAYCGSPHTIYITPAIIDMCKSTSDDEYVASLDFSDLGFEDKISFTLAHANLQHPPEQLGIYNGSNLVRGALNFFDTLPKRLHLSSSRSPSFISKWIDVKMELASCRTTQKHEFEADKRGMYYLARSGCYKPKATLWTLYKMEEIEKKERISEGIDDSYDGFEDERFNSHPSLEKRVANLMATLEEVRREPNLSFELVERPREGG